LIGKDSTHARQSRPLTWWREARFGLFIHWGIYSVPAGFWKGTPIPSLGEWIMHNGKIPLEEYAPLAGQFNPTKFNAEEWVSLAARAGMKYLVITSKHTMASRCSARRATPTTSWTPRRTIMTS